MKKLVLKPKKWVEKGSICWKGGRDRLMMVQSWWGGRVQRGWACLQMERLPGMRCWSLRRLNICREWAGQLLWKAIGWVGWEKQSSKGKSFTVLYTNLFFCCKRLYDLSGLIHASALITTLKLMNVLPHIIVVNTTPVLKSERITLQWKSPATTAPHSQDQSELNGTNWNHRWPEKMQLKQCQHSLCALTAKCK